MPTKHIDLSSISYKKNDAADDLLDSSTVKIPNVKSKQYQEASKVDIPAMPDTIADRLLKSALNNAEKAAEKSVEVLPDKKTDSKAPIAQTNDRRRMILILQFYLLEFPDKLSTFASVDLESKNEKQLADLKNEFDFIIGAKCNIAATQTMFLQGISMLENVCCTFTPLRVQGLSQVCCDEEMRDDCKHLALKYISVVKTEPEMRISYKILTNMLRLHTTNSATNKPIDTIAIENINAKFTNL